MKKEEKLKCETISFEEFIDCITDGRGGIIKKELRKIEEKKKR